MGDNTLEFTGERYIPGMQGGIEAEHMHRYVLAQRLVHGLDVASGEGYGALQGGNGRLARSRAARALNDS